MVIHVKSSEPDAMDSGVMLPSVFHFPSEENLKAFLSNAYSYQKTLDRSGRFPLIMENHRVKTLTGGTDEEEGNYL